MLNTCLDRQPVKCSCEEWRVLSNPEPWFTSSVLLIHTGMTTRAGIAGVFHLPSCTQLQDTCRHRRRFFTSHHALSSRTTRAGIAGGFPPPIMHSAPWQLTRAGIAAGFSPCTIGNTCRHRCRFFTLHHWQHVQVSLQVFHLPPCTQHHVVVVRLSRSGAHALHIVFWHDDDCIGTPAAMSILHRHSWISRLRVVTSSIMETPPGSLNSPSQKGVLDWGEMIICHNYPLDYSATIMQYGCVFTPPAISHARAHHAKYHRAS